MLFRSRFLLFQGRVRPFDGFSSGFTDVNGRLTGAYSVFAVVNSASPRANRVSSPLATVSRAFAGYSRAFACRSATLTRVFARFYGFRWHRQPFRPRVQRFHGCKRRFRDAYSGWRSQTGAVRTRTASSRECGDHGPPSPFGLRRAEMRTPRTYPLTCSEAERRHVRSRSVGSG